MPTPEDLFPATEIAVRGKKLRFSNFAELTSFWEHERNAFRQLIESSRPRQINPSAQFLAQLLGRQNAANAQINEVAQTLRRYPNDLTETQQLELKTRLRGMADNVTTSISAVFAEDTYGIWLSSEPTAQFILELAKSNRDEAAFALLYLKGADFNDESFTAKSGTFKAQLYLANVTNLRGDAETASIRKLAKWTEETTSKMLSEMHANSLAATELNDAHAKAIAEQNTAEKHRTIEFKEYLEEYANEAQKEFGAIREELKKLMDTYDEHMKLKAPVEYWRLKKERHLHERSSLQGWSIFVGMCSFAILGLYVWQNFHETKAGVVPWREIIGFFVLSSVTFWAVKILVRLLLSSIHLAEDAAEREVMAKTYMALVRGDESKTKYMDEKDRALVLGPLFRPSSTGVIDDGAPPHVSEIITRVGR